MQLREYLLAGEKDEVVLHLGRGQQLVIPLLHRH
jgi:hypothetical protein